MVYCSGSTSHIKYETIVPLVIVALRDFGRSYAKEFMTNRKKIFGVFLTSLCVLFFIGQFVIMLEINKSDFRARSSDFVITRMITDRIGLHSVLLPLLLMSMSTITLLSITDLRTTLLTGTLRNA